LTAIRAIFWDVGGVLLTNAWDHTERAEALQHFQLDAEEFRVRHEPLVPDFERGKITLDEYLDRTVFYRDRPFTRDAFRHYMFSLSKSLPGMLDFALALSSSGKYFMGTINNESRELNNYRIGTFAMRNMFRLFLSSCYVGLRKPEPEIYRLALETTQFPAEECCFIDDRAANLEAPAGMGMHTIEMKGLDYLKAELGELGIVNRG
jgi:putative hydrolase of the HAD superfamily